MRITILSSAVNHPVYPYLQGWVEENKGKHEISLINHKAKLGGGDILFLISCTEIISYKERNKYNKTLVIHASDLPKGRGWSPHIWQLIDGAKELVLTLLEAGDKVDSGDVWTKVIVGIPSHVLWDEINERIFRAEIKLINFAIANYFNILASPQTKEAPTYYSKRTPADSEVDPNNTIAEQFNLIRVCDPDRFPAFFKLNGYKYKITLEKLVDE